MYPLSCKPPCAFLPSSPLALAHSRPPLQSSFFRVSVPPTPPPRIMSYPVPSMAHTPHLPTLDHYTNLYRESVTNPQKYWSSVASTFYWKTDPPSTNSVLKHNFNPNTAPVSVSFLEGGVTNVCHNALDRWLPTHKHKPAFLCVGNESGAESTITFEQLHEMVCKFANVLRDLGVKKGDVVVLYMPMVPQLPAAMLACARIGAIHSVVFGGFSAEALAGRIVDSQAKVIVVSDSVGRGKKRVPLRAIALDAIRISQENGHAVTHQVVVKASDGTVGEPMRNSEIDWDEALSGVPSECDIEWVQSEHPLFVLYTSGSTGKPKGVVHSTAGYMCYSATTFKYTFDFHQGDVFFSTSDCGWITGHSYVTYGPLLNGATQVLYEGVPNYPNAGRLWEIVEKHNVNQLYTAPTVIRALKGAAPPPATVQNPNPTPDDWVKARDLSSLRVLGTVGEPINPEAWIWYYDVVGQKRCAIVDTWWQTETGGHCLTPLPIPGLVTKPGSAMMPFFGIEPALLDADGKEVKGEGEGYLVIKSPWPSTLRTVYKDHKRMEETYFSRFPGYYMTGDGARRDKDGHYWIAGRVDDILNVSGHRIGTAEVESALVTHANVSEAAVVGVPHPVKGEALYAYVSLMPGIEPSETLRGDIRICVRKEIGPFAAPDTIHWAPSLPKTRSGKIMRRILRKIAANGKQTETMDLGDTSTLTDPAVIPALLSTFGQ